MIVSDPGEKFVANKRCLRGNYGNPTVREGTEPLQKPDRQGGTEPLLTRGLLQQSTEFYWVTVNLMSSALSESLTSFPLYA